MKRNTLLVIILLIAATGFAQETTQKRNWLTETVMENYHVLKSDKNIKQGLYQATINGKTPLASGVYTGNKRSGIWHFYDTRGQLVQNFDYDKNDILYEEPVTNYSATKIVYSFDTKFTDSDKVTKPMKPGGRVFGYINYLKFYRISQDMYDINPGNFFGIIELLISQGGHLADFKIHIKSNDYERITTFSPDLISDDDKVFVPATLNGEPILCRIFVKCRITQYGELDVD